MATLSLPPASSAPSLPSGRSWPWLLIGLILLSAGGNLVMVFIAVRDPGFAVESNYYQKAVLWDKTMAQEATNETLAWTLRPSFVVSPTGESHVHARLKDKDGTPLTKAKVTLEAFFVARSATPLQKSLLPDASKAGLYTTALGSGLQGIWELRFLVEAQGKRFTQTDRLTLRPLVKP